MADAAHGRGHGAAREALAQTTTKVAMKKFGDATHCFLNQS